MMRPEFTWRFAREAGTFLLLLSALAAGLGVAAWLTGERWLVWAAFGTLITAVLVTAFFRDPERRSPTGKDLVLAPADGRIVRIAPPESGRGPAISIFLSVFNVHINRIPISGEVTRVEYRPGRFRAAFKGEASIDNERLILTITTPRGVVESIQIAGLLARRIVCHARVGDQVRAGERYGLIQFGSRVDVSLPSGTTVLVALGARTRAGVTPLARLAVPGAA
ncbi:MAG: phosphatidylserine decarboxylase [Gemmatimonadota bacterium]